MAIQVICPNCQSGYSLADTLRGKKVRCKNCQGVISVEAAAEEIPTLEMASDLEFVTAGSPLPPPTGMSNVSPPPPPLIGNASPSRVKAKGGNKGLLIGAVVGLAAAFMAIAGVAIGAYFYFQPVGSSGPLAREQPKASAVREGPQKGAPALDLDQALVELSSPSEANSNRSKALGWLGNKDNRAGNESRQGEVFQAIMVAFKKDPSQEFVDAFVVWTDKANVAKLVEFGEKDDPKGGKDSGRVATQRNAALEALSRMNEPAAAVAFARQLPNAPARDENMRRLRSLGPLAEGAVAKLAFHPDAGAQGAALVLLKEWNTKDEVIIDAALEAMRSPNPGYRTMACAQLEKRQPYEPLRAQVARQLGVLLTDSVASVGPEAWRCLEKWADVAALDAVAPLLKNNKDRSQAVIVLKKIGQPAAKSILPYLTHSDAGLRNEVSKLLVLWDVPLTEIVPVVLTDLTSADPNRKIAALDYLAKLNPSDDLKADIAKAIEPLLQQKDQKLSAGLKLVRERWKIEVAVPTPQPETPLPMPPSLDAKTAIFLVQPKVDADVLLAFNRGVTQMEVTEVDANKLEVKQVKSSVPGLAAGDYTTLKVTLKDSAKSFLIFTKAGRTFALKSKITKAAVIGTATVDFRLATKDSNNTLMTVLAGVPDEEVVATTPPPTSGATRMYFFTQAGMNKTDLENLKKGKLAELEIIAAYADRKGTNQVMFVQTFNLDAAPDVATGKHPGWRVKATVGSTAEGEMRVYMPPKQTLGTSVKLSEIVFKGEARANYAVGGSEFKGDLLGKLFVWEATVIGEVAVTEPMPKVDPFPKDPPPFPKDPPPQDDKLKTIVEDLKAQEINKRHDALRQLGQSGHPAAAGIMVSYLTMHPKEHDFVGNTLKMLGPSAQPAVVQLLGKNHPTAVRIEACQVLQAIGTQACVPSLQPLLKEREQGLQNAARDAIKLASTRR